MITQILTYATLNTKNVTNDYSEILVYVNEITNGLFIPLVLLAFFTIICFGSYFSMQRISGRGFFIGSFAVASYMTFGLSVLLALKDGLITTFVIVVILAVSVIATALLMLSKD